MASVFDVKAWVGAAPVVVAVFGAALILDVSALAKMFLAGENANKLYMWSNWLVTFVFMASFLNVMAIPYQNFEELWSQRNSLIFLVASFGYLIVFFAAVSFHHQWQAAMGSKRPSPTSVASIIFGIVFACGCMAWRLLVPNNSRTYKVVSSVVTTSASSPALLTGMIWLLALVLGAVLYFARGGLESSESTHSFVKKGRKFRKDRSKTYPATYPNGWYKIAESSEVPVGKVIEAQALGKVFAVFRGEDQKVAILDAYCVHLGANMAVGGRVVGNCLECPFHKWRFNGDGTCAHIPYSEKIPEIARTRSWPVREYYGLICIYYDADGQDPPYQLDPFPEIDNGDFVYRGIHHETVNMHIQEFAENSVDYMHFDPLHGRMSIPWTNIEIPLLTIKHTARWELDSASDRSHVSYFHDHAVLLFRGREMPSTAADAKITFMGPGSVVSFRFTIPKLGEIVMFQTHTPVEPCRMQVTFFWYADKSIPRILVWYVIGNWIAQWRNDIFVWENKIYLSRPLLVRGDGPVAKLRRWYAQFYSETNMNENPGAAQMASCGAAADW